MAKNKSNFANSFFIFILFAIIFIFIKLLINSYNLQTQLTGNQTPILYTADHGPIKIYPKKEKDSSSMNERVYDFINKKSWKFDPNVTGTQNEQQDQVEAIKKSRDERSTAGNVVKYKNTTIRIVENPKHSQDTKSQHNMVQIGAFTSLDKAEQEWERLKAMLPAKYKDQNHYIEKTYIEQKGLIYRLKAGPFMSSTAAQNFCKQIRKKGVGCFLTIN